MATSSPVPVSTAMLTLKYSGATVSALIATFGALTLFSALFGLWTDKASGTLLFTGYVGVVTTAVMTALFSVLAFLLYRRVTKDVAAQPEYVNTSAYTFVTNSFFAVLAVMVVIIVAQLISILLSSLLLIGTSTDIGGMYLNEFLPGLLAAAIVAFVGFAAYKIMKGKNVSALMTIVLMSLAGALLIATLITVPIKAHMTTVSSSSTPNIYNYDDYFKTYYNTNN